MSQALKESVDVRRALKGIGPPKRGITLDTARSTTSAQPGPGTARGPLLVPVGELRTVLGVGTITFGPGIKDFAVTNISHAQQGTGR